MIIATLGPAQTNPLEAIAISMLAVSAEAKLPKLFKNDLSIDIEMINKFDADFVWVLKECGSELQPIKKGGITQGICKWLDAEGRASGNLAFLISKSDYSIKPISSKKAIELIRLPPFKLTAANGLDALIDKINALLVSQSWHAWGGVISNESKDRTAHWNDYLAYFRQSNHEVMTDFMYKAIDITSNLQLKACSIKR